MCSNCSVRVGVGVGVEFVPIVCCTGPMSRLLFFSFLALSSIFVLLLFLDSERSPEDLYIPGYIHRVEKLL